MTPGTLIRQARREARLSLSAVARAMGISVPYLHDVEHDSRRLATERWPALVAAVPGLTLRDLADAMVESGAVTIDASTWHPVDKADLVAAIARGLDA